MSSKNCSKISLELEYIAKTLILFHVQLKEHYPQGKNVVVLSNIVRVVLQCKVVGPKIP